jgi:hypothetical protein
MSRKAGVSWRFETANLLLTRFEDTLPMARLITVSLELPDDLLLALGRAARAAGCGPSAYLGAALAAALERPERFVAAERVGQALSRAKCWLDLQRRLRAEGFVLRLIGEEERLWLCLWPENRPLFEAGDLGVDLAGLCLRFRADFPGRGLRIPAPAPPRRRVIHRAA